MHILLWKVYLSWDFSIMVPHCSVTWQTVLPWNNGNCAAWVGPEAPQRRTCYPVAGECSHSTASSYQSIQGLFGLPCPRSHLFLGGLKACCVLPHVGPAPSFFLMLLIIVLLSSPVAYWTPSDRGVGGSSFGVISFCLFIQLMGFSWQGYGSDFPFPPQVF